MLDVWRILRLQSILGSAKIAEISPLKPRQSYVTIQALQVIAASMTVTLNGRGASETEAADLHAKGNYTEAITKIHDEVERSEGKAPDKILKLYYPMPAEYL